MNVGIRRHEQLALVRPIDRQRVERRAIHHLHAIDQPRSIESTLGLGLFERGATPAGVVVHNESPLRTSFTHRLGGIGVVDCIVVGGKESVVVTDGLGRASDLNTRNNGQSVALCGLACQLDGQIQIRGDTMLVGRLVDNAMILSLSPFGEDSAQRLNHISLVATILDVLGDSQHVQTVIPRLAHTKFGRAVAVRVDRVGVQIGLVDRIAIDLGQHKLDTLRRVVERVASDVGVFGVLVVVLRRRCRGDQQRGKQYYRTFHSERELLSVLFQVVLHTLHHAVDQITTELGIDQTSLLSGCRDE